MLKPYMALINYFGLFVLGLAMGSFVNALVWRVHEQSTTKSKKRLTELSITRGRSMCTHCKHKLSFLDLVPVFSWVSLGGKCRYCGEKIGLQYPIVELATGILFVVFYIFWPFGFSLAGWLLFVLWLIIVTLMNALFVYDVRWMLLPNRLVYPLIALSAVFSLAAVFISDAGWISQIALLIIGALLLFGFFYGLFVVSDGKWIGGGDVKLVPAVGLLAGGPLGGFLVVFIASFIGTIIGLPLLLVAKNKKQLRLPFGPLLIVATYIVFIFGDQMLQLYREMFLTP